MTSIVVPEPLDWSPDAPHSQAVCGSPAERQGRRPDPERFGFRSIETRAGRIYLNGRPLVSARRARSGLLSRQHLHAPSEAFLEDQFRKAKALGLNCLRCHIKVPDPRYYAVADRVGLLIWTELPTRAGSRHRRASARKRPAACSSATAITRQFSADHPQ